MKTIVISIRPEWACKILNGEKSIEVRKGLALYNALKKAKEKGEEVEFLMYVTTAKPHLKTNQSHSTFYLTEDSLRNLNGKVVAKFKGDAGRIDVDDMGILYEGDGMSCETLLHGSRLTFKQLDDYLLGGKGTALHIRDLKIFDKPKTLADYGLKRAPQSWGYTKKGGTNGES